MSDSVSFDKQGSYHIGDPLKEMDVQTEKAAQPRFSNVSMHLPPQAPFAGGAVSPRPTFDLNALRQKTAAAPAPVPTVQPEPKVEVKVEEKPVEEVPAEEPKAVEVEETTPAVAPVEEATPPAEEASAEPELAPVESAEQEVEEAPTPKSQGAGFNLSQLGLTNRTFEESATKEVKETSTTSVGQGSIKPMQLEDKPQEVPAESQPEVEAAKEAAPAEEVAEEAAAEEKEAMTFNEDTPFEIVSLKDILHMLCATEGVVSEWVGRVCKEYTRRPTTIFSCGTHQNLRAYSMTYPLKPKGNIVYITMGVGKKITTCAYDGKRKVLSDASAQISVSGTCAFVQDAPVASCAQRERTAVRL